MSSKTRFSVGLHVLSYLASCEEPVNSSRLARSVGTNPVVIRRILSCLSEAGLVDTQRGRSGGSSLALEPNEITLLEIFEAVDDGPLLYLHPLNRRCPLARKTRPGLEAVADRTQAAVHEALHQITLAETISKH